MECATRRTLLRAGSRYPASPCGPQRPHRHSALPPPRNVRLPRSVLRSGRPDRTPQKRRMTVRDLFKIAAAEIGQAEVPGEVDNPRIVKYATESGIGWVTDDETPWCSTFMNWIAFEAGVERTDRANARSWLTVGRKVEPPEPGDVVIFWREAVESHKGHVGLFVGYSADGSRVYVLGGNQGNQVGITAYDATRVLGFRRLRPPSNRIPDPTLRRGDRGEKVVRLQDALKLVDFEPGTSDGDFGGRTETAIKALQATSDTAEINGVYDVATRAALDVALQDLG